MLEFTDGYSQSHNFGSEVTVPSEGGTGHSIDFTVNMRHENKKMTLMNYVYWLPRYDMHSAEYIIQDVCLSDCPSVRPSVTRRYCVEAT